MFAHFLGLAGERAGEMGGQVEFGRGGAEGVVEGGGDGVGEVAVGGGVLESGRVLLVIFLADGAVGGEAFKPALPAVWATQRNDKGENKGTTPKNLLTRIF